MREGDLNVDSHEPSASTGQAPARITSTLLDEIVAAFNAHDVHTISQYFAEDATFCMASGPEPFGLTVVGRAAIARVLEERFGRIPDMRWEGSQHHVMGAHAVSVWRVRGHVDNGKEIDVQGCDLWEFEDELIVHKDTYWKQRTESPVGLKGS
jgi:ketosteroid isomerase-like protein